MNKFTSVLGALALWLLAAVAHAGTVAYVYTDPQGTPLAEANASGTITARFDYAPYGQSVTSMGAAPNGPGYTGHVNDPDTGLVYMQARYYDPSLERFLSADPVAPAAGNLFNFNRYDYTNNNPINHIDPDGRCADGLTCDQMVQRYGKWADANPEKADKLGRTVGVPGVTTMLIASGLGEVVGLVRTIVTIDKVLSDSPSPTPTAAENTNPYEGPVDAPVVVVDRDGNAIPVETGQSIGVARKTGDYQEVKGADGQPTGDRLDRGGHRNQRDPQAQQPHAHRPGVTDPNGNPHLPINPRKTPPNSQ